MSYFDSFSMKVEWLHSVTLLACVSAAYTWCSDTTVQTMQNENLRNEFTKVVQRTIPR